MQESSERLLWEAQGGFRPGRGCMDQIFSLCMITEKFLAVNQKVFCAFVDLENVFDTAKLWEILLRYNVSGPLLQAIKKLARRLRDLCKETLQPATKVRSHCTGVVSTIISLCETPFPTPQKHRKLFG